MQQHDNQMQAEASVVFQMETVCERDIDLLLLEEFACNATFRQTMFSRAFGHDVEETRLAAVAHSVADGDGESDIEVLVETAAGTLALLIENKIDAPFQPDQAARYRHRGERRKGSGYADYRVMLVAPSAYLKRADGQDWPCQVSYEEIAEMLAVHLASERLSVKATLLRLSVAKKEERQVVADDAMTAFWEDYHRLLSARFPELILHGAGKPKSTSATWGEMKVVGWPSSILLYIKLPEGKVDLTFNGRQADELMSRFKGVIDHDMTVLQTGKSTAVRLTVPPVRPQDGFDGQMLELFSTMLAAQRLAALYPVLAKTLEG